MDRSDGSMMKVCNNSVPRELMPDDFTVDFSTGLPRDTVVNFYKATCPFCKAFYPSLQCVVEQLSSDLSVEVVQ